MRPPRSGAGYPGTPYGSDPEGDVDRSEADPRVGTRRWVAGSSSGPLLHRRRDPEFPHSALAAWESVVLRARDDRDPPSATAGSGPAAPVRGAGLATARGAGLATARGAGLATARGAGPALGRPPARPAPGGRPRHSASAQSVRSARPVRSDGETQLEAEGVESNARLTGMTAAALLVLLAVEGLTLLRVRSLLTPHVVVGMVLVPPVLLKIGSTTWRFGRYYLGSPAYRRKGPPPPLLRLLGPFVVVLTVAVLATGIALLLGPASMRNTLLLLHKATFVLWFGAMVLHVLGHLLDTARLAPRDFYRRTRRQVRGASTRQWALAATLAVGLLLGVLVAPTVGPWLAGTGVGNGRTAISHVASSHVASRSGHGAATGSATLSGSTRTSAGGG
ncbi:MAG: hypothetical protein ACYCU7_02795 [Acidimicrobiales bacterium]